MTREAARSGFEAFLDDAVAATREEFSVERALRGTGFAAGGTVVDREEAVDLVENAFPFTGVLREFPAAFTFEVRIDPGSVLGGPFAGALPAASIEYTGEAKRAMRRAERRVIEETKREVTVRFDGG